MFHLDPWSLALVSEIAPGVGPEERRDYDWVLRSTHCDAAATTVTAIRKVRDPDRRVRLMRLASEVWHERRHFLDLLLTNYGAKRFRRVFQMCCAIGSVLRFASRTGEPLICPIDPYLTDLQRRSLGLPKPSELELDAFRALVEWREAEQVDEPGGTIQTAGGPVRLELGGEAHLEALAIMGQSQMLRTQFTQDDWREIGRDLGEDSHKPRYWWWTAIAEELGLSGKVDEAETVVTYEVAAVGAILLASLFVRDPDEEGACPDACFVHTRLAVLIEHARNRPLPVRSSFIERFEWVDDLCRIAFGRSMEDEIAIATGQWSDFIDWLRQQPGASEILPVALEYHQARTRLLQQTPLPAYFDVSVGAAIASHPELVPRILAANPRGLVETRFNNAADTASELVGATVRDLASGNVVLRAAWVQRLTAAGNSGTVFSDVWDRWASQLVPLTKMACAGPFVIAGHDLAAACRSFRQLAIAIRPVPGDRPPWLELPVDCYWLEKGGDTSGCDHCNVELTRGHGALLSPWVVKWNRRTLDSYLAECPQPVVSELLTLWDCSPWFVCANCRATFLARCRDEQFDPIMPDVEDKDIGLSS